MKKGRVYLLLTVLLLIVISGCFKKEEKKVEAPKSVEVSKVSFRKAILVWQRAKNANGYIVFRSTTKTGDYTEIKRVNTTSFTNNDLQEHTEYYYKVKSYSNKKVSTNFSNIAKVKTKGRPLNISSSVKEDDILHLDWEDIEGVTGYKVYKSLNKETGFEVLPRVTESEYFDKNLKPGRTYYYMIVSLYEIDSSDYSEVVEGKIKEKEKLTQPTGLQGTALKNIVSLRWNEVLDSEGGFIDGYHIYRQTIAGFIKIKTSINSYFDDENLEYGTKYTYYVEAYDGDIVSPKSEVITVETESESTLEKPKNLKTEKKENGIVISWDKVNGATEYVIYKKLNSSFEVLETTSSTSYRDNAVEKGQTYYYKIQATNSNGSSDLSVQISGKIPFDNTDLDIPTGIVANITYDSIELKWDSVLGATKYEIFVMKGSEFIRLTTVSTTSYINVNLDPGNTYFYKIRAINEKSESEFSEVKSYKTDDGISAPIIKGVSENGIYKYVEISVEKVFGVTYTAKIDNKNYVLGTRYETSGEHTLVVDAEKNGNKASKTIKFEIKKDAPSAPIITGVTEKGIYQSVRIYVEKESNTTYTAKINSTPYSFGTEFKTVGEHTVVVEAIKNGLKAFSIINFEIRVDAPNAPIVTGVSDGGKYTSVKINVEKEKDVDYQAHIDGEKYNFGDMYNKNGRHTIVVKATKNEITAKTAITFTIDNEAPGAPIVSGVTNNGVYTEVIINVEKEKDVNYEATIDGESFDLGTKYSKSGKHILVVTAEKNALVAKTIISFEIDSKAPNAPIVRGVTNNGVYTSVRIFIEEENGIIYNALLNGEVYDFGTSFNESGKHSLVVFAKKASNGLIAKTSINFTIDNQAPKSPLVTGVTENGIYTEVVINVEKELDVVYKAYIDGLDYNFGDVYSTKGLHTLIVFAEKKSNGKKAKSTINFTIDNEAPDTPLVTGVTENGIYTDVTINVEQEKGVIYSAFIDGSEYILGTKYSKSGSHTLVVFAEKASNGKKAKTTISFTIDSDAPNAPLVTGVTEKGIYTDVTINVEQEKGVIYTAFIDGSEYTLGTKYSDSGSHTLVVFAEKASNGKKAKTTISFTIDSDAPNAPLVTGVTENGTYSDVIINVEQENGVIYTAFIDGSEYTLGTKYSDSGSHTLVVFAEKKSNGKKAKTAISFTIDSDAPNAPLVTGVTENGIYTEVVISIEKETGVIYTSTIDGVNYTLGSKYNKAGNHTLVVTAKKATNNLMAKTTISFTIDSDAPKAPVVTGVSQGGVYTDVTINVVKVSGLTYISKINGVDYELGTKFSKEGKHTLIVTAKKATNNLVAKTSISFTIDSKAPNAPKVSGVAEGGIYTEATINVEKETGIEYEASIDGVKYDFGSIYKMSGSHSLVVYAKKTSNNLVAKTTINFTIDSDAPNAPIISGVSEGGVYTEIIINIQKETGVDYRAFINGNSYTFGDVFKTEGKHTLLVEAEKKSNGLIARTSISFTIDKSAPKAPSIIGVSEGGIYTSVKINVEKENGVTYKATIDGIAYTLGNEYAEEGNHTVIISAEKLSNGLTAKTSVNFKIDKDAPSAPIIKGVSEGGIFTSVKINVEKENGVTYKATIDGIAYTLGTDYSKAGNHSLVVTATKDSNNLTAKSVVNFTIDSDAPNAPIVKGVSEGGTYKDVTITVDKESGNTYTAEIDGNSYTLGTKYAKSGSHTLVVFATKESNGLTAKTIVSFVIDNDAPNAPVIIGVEDGKVYDKAVTITVEEVNGVEYTATIDGSAYKLGSSYSKVGSHVLVVIAEKISNGLTSKTSMSFEIDSEEVGPNKPVITGVIENEVYESVTINVSTKETGVTYSAKIDTTNYTLGTLYSIEGKHSVTVVATKTSNGLKATSVVNFEIKKKEVGPKKPIIVGVEQDKTYSSVTITLSEKELGVTYVATIDGNSYTLGNKYTKSGSHTIIVKATKDSNGLEATTEINFKIASTALNTPLNLRIPIFSSNSISLEWSSVDGATGYYVYRQVLDLNDDLSMLKKPELLVGNEIADTLFNSYSDDNINSDKLYFYYVQAYNSTTSSGITESVSVKIIDTLLNEEWRKNAIHENSITDVSADNLGNTFASADSKGNVKIYDKNGNIIQEITDIDKEIVEINLNDDGSLLGIGLIDGNVNVVDTSNGSYNLSKSIHSGSVTSVSFIGNDLIATGGEDKKVVLTNVESGNVVETLSINSVVSKVNFKNGILAVGTAEGEVKLYNENYQEQLSFSAHGNVISAIATENDKNILITGSNDNSVKIWDISTGNKLKEINSFTDYISGIEIIGDNFVTSSLDSSVKVWDLKTGAFVESIDEIYKSVTGIESSNNKIIISSGYDVITLSDGNSSETIATPKNLKILDGDTDSIKLIWDGVSGAKGYKIYKKTVNQGSKVSEASSYSLLRDTYINGYEDLDVSLDKTSIYSIKAYNESGESSYSKTVMIRISSSQYIVSKTLANAHEKTINSIVYNSTKNTFVTGSADGVIKIWNINGTSERTISIKSEEISKISISNDGNLIAAGLASGEIKVFNYSTGSEKISYINHSNSVTGIVFNSNDSSIISSSIDKKVILTNVSTGNEDESKMFLQSISDIEIVDSKLVVATSDNKITILNISNLSTIDSYTKHTDIINGIDGNSNKIITGSNDGDVVVYNTQSKMVDLVIEAGNDYINNIVATNNSVFSAGNDKSVKIWDLTTGAISQSLEGIYSSVSGIAVSDDSTYLAIGNGYELIIYKK